MRTGIFQRGSALVTTSLCTRPTKLRTKLFLSGFRFPLLFQYRALVTSASLEDASAVRIVEVGPRDGLQNIKQSIATPIKVELIQGLASAGLRNIEATSFVSPKWVPQLADGATVMKQILPLAQQRQIRFPVLAPNAKGLENAIQSGAKEVVVFASVTEAFSKKNQNCTVEEALGKAREVAEKARRQDIAVRG
jgi:hydroxymethylglutaryl-CoA lyase